MGTIRYRIRARILHRIRILRDDCERIGRKIAREFGHMRGLRVFGYRPSFRKFSVYVNSLFVNLPPPLSFPILFTFYFRKSGTSAAEHYRRSLVYYPFWHVSTRTYKNPSRNEIPSHLRVVCTRTRK